MIATKYDQIWLLARQGQCVDQEAQDGLQTMCVHATSLHFSLWGAIRHGNKLPDNEMQVESHRTCSHESPIMDRSAPGLPATRYEQAG